MKTSVNKLTIVYGLALAVLLVLLKKLEWHFLVINHAFEIYATLIALLFLGLGIWLTLKLVKTKTIVVQQQVVINNDVFEQNQINLQTTRISKRELEVLQLIAKGLTNQQIADALFVSLNTVKTHTSKLFEKLGVSRRTQAIEKATQLALIP